MNRPGAGTVGRVTDLVQARPPYFSVALVAGIALAFEVLLIRLFSIIQWHHFAYLIISLALLGVGASGTLAALARERLVRLAPRLFPWLLCLFAASILASFHLAQRVPFNVEELFWDASQLPALALVYMLLAIPFFLSGLAVCLALAAWPERIPNLYAADLMGAGAGAMTVVALLAVLPAEGALAVLSGAGFAACLVSLLELRLPRARGVAAIAVSGLAMQFFLPSVLVISPYKPLAQLLEVSGAHIVETRSGPLGAIAVVESSDIPLRHAPGLSLTASSGPGAQLALFVDADGMSAITEYGGDRHELAYLDFMTSAAPYHLKTMRRVAVLGAGAGSGVLQALHHDAGAVDAVEMNPQVVDLVASRFADRSGHLYRRAPVTTHIADARGFMEATDARFDLVQLELVDSFAGSTGGLRAVSESYLYTVEAIDAYLSRLRAGGLVAITRWVQIPPREIPKLVATVARVLAARGAADPGSHLFVLRGWQTATLLVGNAPFTAMDITRLRRFCTERAFDTVWYPGIDPAQTNRHNVLREPYFYEAVASLLGDDPDTFAARYKFDLTPATDDRPFFGHFMKWSSFAEIWSLRTRGGVAMVEWGYVVLVVALTQAILVSLVLILLPLAVGARQQVATVRKDLRVRVLLYFCAIGLAFLFIEIAVLQKLILLLWHPLHASVTTLSGFLVFAGLGSVLAGRLLKHHSHGRILFGAVIGIGLSAAALLTSFDSLVSLAWAQPAPARVGIAIILIAPLALCMGIPFATAMQGLSQTAPSLVPWAWAVNGCASVISAVLAALLAVHFGFERVILLALVLYLVAALSLPRMPAPSSP